MQEASRIMHESIEKSIANAPFKSVLILNFIGCFSEMCNCAMAHVHEMRF
jgi:hypothetical protein